MRLIIRAMGYFLVGLFVIVLKIMVHFRGQSNARVVCNEEGAKSNSKGVVKPYLSQYRRYRPVQVYFLQGVSTFAGIFRGVNVFVDKAGHVFYVVNIDQRLGIRVNGRTTLPLQIGARCLVPNSN